MENQLNEMRTLRSQLITFANVMGLEQALLQLSFNLAVGAGFTVANVAGQAPGVTGFAGAGLPPGSNLFGPTQTARVEEFVKSTGSGGGFTFTPNQASGSAVGFGKSLSESLKDPRIASAVTTHLTSGKGFGTHASDSLAPRGTPAFKAALAKEAERAKTIFNAASISNFQHGGIINEPIFGLGQRTGKAYQMGEAGPEMITPLTGKSSVGGDSYNATFNVFTSDIKFVETYLKPQVLRWMQETKSRRGIL